MDNQITGERVAEERAFVKRYTDGLGSRPVEYGAEYVTPLEDRPRKVPVIPTSIADPPESMQVDETAQPDKLNIIVKSLKPSLTFPISASLTDPISTLKSLVAASSPSAPPVDTQRLLLKGKALVDTKLLKEYDISEGSTIHLVLKPTSVPLPTLAMDTGNKSTNSAIASGPDDVSGKSNNPPPLQAGASIQHGKSASLSASSSTGSIPRPAGHGHARVPSLTITTDVDARPGSPGAGSPLIVTDAPPLGPQAQVSSAAFHQTVSDPQFWQKLHALCVGEFTHEDDADAAWEGFLVSMKGRLSAGEAALIRDVVGVRGMGGGA